MRPKPSRQRAKQIHVPVLPAEAADIKAHAAQCGLPVAAYLRGLGLSYQPKTIFDADAVMELARINGDLGRLGGLLKMWLSNDHRWEHFGGKEQGFTTINALLDDLIKTQAVLFEAARKL